MPRFERYMEKNLQYLPNLEKIERSSEEEDKKGIDYWFTCKTKENDVVRIGVDLKTKFYDKNVLDSNLYYFNLLRNNQKKPLLKYGECKKFIFQMIEKKEKEPILYMCDKQKLVKDTYKELKKTLHRTEKDLPSLVMNLWKEITTKHPTIYGKEHVIVDGEWYSLVRKNARRQKDGENVKAEENQDLFLVLKWDKIIGKKEYFQNINEKIKEKKEVKELFGY